MVWLYPAALVGLAAALGPVLVHLLRRQRARTLIVPTVRFIPTVDQSVVRVRRPTDVGLLLLRIAIVSCAALALARPLLLTDSRAAGWSDRIARVVIVDITGSAAGAVDPDAVRTLEQSAAYVHRIDAGDLAAALRRAAAWLETAPPARREVAIVSDFQRGALAPADLLAVPQTVGLRFVSTAAEGGAGPREVAAEPVLSREGTLRRTARITGETSAATFVASGVAQEGLRILAPAADAADVELLRRVVARAGAAAPSAVQPIVVRFPGGDALPAGPVDPAGSAEAWARAAGWRLLRAADAASLPLSAVPRGGELHVDVQATPGTFAAAASVKAALDARVDPGVLAEQEVAHLSDATLRAWTRDPAPADPAAWRQSEESDGRWFWLGALVLLGVEAAVRRSRAAHVREVPAHAA